MAFHRWRFNVYLCWRSWLLFSSILSLQHKLDSWRRKRLHCCSFGTPGKQHKSQKYTWDTFTNALATPYAYLLALDFICINIGNQIPLNFSIIMKKMGYDADLANYLISPIYGLGAVTIVVIGWISDRFGERAWIIIIVQIWVAIWYPVLFTVNRAATPFWPLVLSSFAIINNISMFPFVFSFINNFFCAWCKHSCLVHCCIDYIGNLVPLLASEK